MKRISKTSVIAVQVFLAIGVLFQFFNLAPWLDCKPIDQLPDNYNEKLVIPKGAQCFNINHGKVHFENHGPISEDLELFIFYTFLFLLTCICLIVLNVYYRKRFSKQESSQVE
jgi:hypothetical protein